MIQAENLLKEVRGRSLIPAERARKAIQLAGLMLEESKRIQTSRERKKQKELARMVADPIGKVFATRLTDQCFRSSNQKRVADQMRDLIHTLGVPRFFSPFKKLQLSLFSLFGPMVTQFFVPLVRRLIRKETATVILPGEQKALEQHIAKRHREGVRVNLNHLGEAILGEGEAKQRLQRYLDDLAHPDIDYISVKISTLYSQINLLGWDQSLKVLAERLKWLYRTAKRHSCTDEKGKKVSKFVNLDMEEYRDLRMTTTLFRTVLDDPEFYDYSAGIVLQSYLPDAFLFQQELTVWAIQRVMNGGAPIKIRLVKGANLAMEKVEASLKDWEQAPYPDKVDVDANYKRMMQYGCQPQNASAVHLGIASHNLFDIAYGMLLREENEVGRWVGFEMLEGMAEAQKRVVHSLTGGMVLYCPVAKREEFQHAVAYLTRRLDENTASENFLRHLFDLKEGSPSWKEQVALFTQACEKIDSVSYVPRRQQNRLQTPHRHEYDTPFTNAPDSDWSLPQQRIWAERIINDQAKQEPIAIACATGAEIESALEASEKQKLVWEKKSLQERCRLLDELAYQLQCHRGELIGAMVAETGKTVPEADVEVSEAVDFAHYYRRMIVEVQYMQDVSFSPKGIVLVTPPWNFPCSIPAGGIIAALTTGNVVLFKPAPEAIFVGWTLAKIFCEAGFPKECVQFINCHDEPEGTALISDPRVSVVVLTGATSTALHFLKSTPGLDLVAETGGKNSMIITAAADRDLAIRDLLQSAFGHAGQKCSACSLAILEQEVYDDPHFLRQLHDAASSLTVGSAWSLSTKVNPLIRPAEGALLRGLTTLDIGEEWVLKPKQDPHNPKLWSPGIKKGVRLGSFTQQTELFGPVLGLICAKNLDDAIAIANHTVYGLTAGLHSLDHREHARWLDKIEAGNCYINRGMTGAIVQRQPFGGCKASSFGPGAKAGGPNYLLQLMRIEQKNLPEERDPVNEQVLHLSHRLQDLVEMEADERNLWMASIGSYAFFWNQYFSQDRDVSHVLGQDNFIRYLPRKTITLRVQESDLWIDAMRVAAAALTCGTRLVISHSDAWKQANLPELLKNLSSVQICIESDEELNARILNGGVDRLRLLKRGTVELYSACAEACVNAITAPVMANGRIELLHFLREVSISSDYHRYGYLGEREPRVEQQTCQKGSCGSCSCG